MTQHTHKHINTQAHTHTQTHLRYEHTYAHTSNTHIHTHKHAHTQKKTFAQNVGVPPCYQDGDEQQQPCGMGRYGWTTCSVLGTRAP